MTELEIWAVARHVLHIHGDVAGRVFIDDRVGEMTLMRDQAGIDFWKLVAVKFESLASGEPECR